MIYRLFKILMLVCILAGCNRNTYILIPQPGAEKALVLMQMPDSLIPKFNGGVDYYATGNEPASWQLNMDLEGQFSFLSDGNNLSLIAKTGVKTNTGSIYTLSDAAGNMTINIVDSYCEGTKTQKTIVTINNKIYKGCGLFLYDRKLEGKWQLAKIKNKVIERSDYPKLIPEIVFNTLNKLISVNTACNKVSLAYMVSGHKLSVPASSSTNKRCKTKFDEILNNSFYGKVCSYFIKGNSLTLYLLDDSIIEFSRL